MLVRAFSPLRTSCPHWSAILCNTGVSAHSQISAYDLSSSGEHSISSSTMERNHIPLRHTPQARKPLGARQWRLRVSLKLRTWDVSQSTPYVEVGQGRGSSRGHRARME